MRPLLVAALVVLVLAGCSSMLVGGSASGGADLGEDRRSTAQMNADDSLTGTIRSRFAQDSGIRQYDVGVSTRNGVVTLTGTVGSFAIRDRAVGIARNTDGVGSVSNQIAVNTQQ